MTTTAQEFETKAAQAIAEATAMIEAGFTTKAARDRSTNPLGKAFEAIKSAMSQRANELVHGREEAGDKPGMHRAHDFYWSIPYSLGQWKPKQTKIGHAVKDELISTLLPMVEALHAKRAACMEAEISVVPRKAERAIQPGDKTQQRGHCQCCGKLHAVCNGVIAAHGYTVQWNSFNNPCTGSAEPPIEHSRKKLDGRVWYLNKSANEHEEQAALFDQGRAKLEKIKVPMRGGYTFIGWDEASDRQRSASSFNEAIRLRNRARMERQLASALESWATEYHGKPLKVVAI